MAEQIPNFTCKYSGCHDGINGRAKEYYACPECARVKYWKEYACCVEHGFMYQNEVAIARNKEIPFPEMIDRMIEDGVLDKSYGTNIVERSDIDETVKEDIAGVVITDK